MKQNKSWTTNTSTRKWKQSFAAKKMSELVKDSAIKLFGKTISLSQKHTSSETSISSQDSKEHESNSITPLNETSRDRSTSSDITEELKAVNILSSAKTPTEEEQSERTETLKKPDKLLPCPRCNSMETKFCYYNNYNVQQPRYFCKNCQRYWTAGGVMRNVPVGSGRRKNKNVFTPNYNQGVSVSSLTPNGFVVFGSDAFHDEPPSNSNFDEGLRNCAPPNGLTPSGTNFTFYPPTPYWGGPIQYPWHGPQFHQMPSILGKHSREGVMLGQSNFERNNILEKGNPEQSVLIPKTLRIHDPSDAAKSSIWSTLGIKNEQLGSNDGRNVFKAFVAKGDRSSNMDNASLALQANPAAFSRSLRFQESA